MGRRLSVGDRIPSFCLYNQNGEKVCISPEDEEKRIIYFYPRNNTRYCTEQACSFRDWREVFIDRGYQVFGISSDSVKSHKKFRSQHKLNFSLLSDEKSKVRSLFGAGYLWGLFPNRKTFVIDERGIIVYIYNALFEGSKHVQQLLNII